MTTLANPLGTRPFYWNVGYITRSGARVEWRDSRRSAFASYAFRVRPWIPHDGGPCPVEPHVRVRVRTRDGWIDSGACAADEWGADWWCHGATEDDDDIIAYQIIED